jgi:hypothetical protein
VPAFKEAQLAIAMNDGAQISKDVADIVLLITISQPYHKPLAQEMTLNRRFSLRLCSISPKILW